MGSALAGANRTTEIRPLSQIAVAWWSGEVGAGIDENGYVEPNCGGFDTVADARTV
jgi:hypothetical protein